VAVILLVGGAVLLAGVIDADDAEDVEAPVHTVSEQEQEIIDGLEADADALDADHQVTMTFNPDIGQRAVDRIEREWRANPRLHLVLTLDADLDEDATGFAVAGIAAWADDADLDEAERFACAYAGRPGVAMVGIDEDPCDPPTPPATPMVPTEPPPVLDTVSLTANFHTGQDLEDIEAVRQQFDRTGLFTEVSISPPAGPMSPARLYASGIGEDAAAICAFVRPYDDNEEVILSITGYVPGCPDFS
jgi:hypothetical protein